MHIDATLYPDERESTYLGPALIIPDFITGDPSEFRLKIALENLLPSDATTLFRYQLLMDHLRLNEDEDTFFIIQVLCITSWTFTNGYSMKHGVQNSENQMSDHRRRIEQKPDRGRAVNPAGCSATILHGSDESLPNYLPDQLRYY